MCQVLSISAYFILTFDDQDAVFAQDAMGLFAGFEVKVKNGIVIFRPFKGWLSI